MKAARGLVVPLLAVVLVGCATSGPTGDPTKVVLQAMQLVEQGQLDDLADLACENRRDDIAGDLGIGQALPEGLPPGFDAQAFASAFTIDTGDLVVTDAGRTGDKATVHVAGTIGVTVDRQRLADLIRNAGLPVDEAFLSQIIDGIGEQLANGVPIDQNLNLINEGGTWKIC